jgi:hypothetical protein
MVCGLRPGKLGDASLNRLLSLLRSPTELSEAPLFDATLAVDGQSLVNAPTFDYRMIQNYGSFV